MDCERIRKQHVADEYRAGRLSPEDREAYEHHFFGCDRCFEDLRFRANLAEHIEEEGSSLFASEIRREQSIGRRERGVRKWRLRLPEWRTAFSSHRVWVTGVAAVAALIIIFFAFDRATDRSAMFKDLSNPSAHPYVASELRGGVGSAEFHRGMEHYAAGRYNDAVDWLRLSIESGASNGEVHFYLGVSLMMSGDPRGATEALQTASDHTPSSALYLWYLSQVELKSGRVDAAENELSKIVTAGGEFAAEAESLLQKISEVRNR